MRCASFINLVKKPKFLLGAMVELVDTHVLGTCHASGESSNLSSPTKKRVSTWNFADTQRVALEATLLQRVKGKDSISKSKRQNSRLRKYCYSIHPCISIVSSLTTTLFFKNLIYALPHRTLCHVQQNFCFTPFDQMQHAVPHRKI